MTAAKTLKEKFFGKLEIVGECVVWTGALGKSGYGRIAHNNQWHLPTHVSWFLRYGVWPTMLCHTCDNPPCVRIKHLWEGTHQDNMDDKVRKNRQSKGSQIWSAKLTEQDIEEIRRLTEEERWPAKRVAALYSVNKATIHAIRQARGWRHVNQEKMIKPKQVRKEPHDMTYDVGDRRLRVSEIAELAGRTKDAIYYRLNQGVRGEALLAKRKRYENKKF